MSSDDFYNKIDQSISKSNSAEESRKELVAQRREYLKEIILRLIPIVKEHEKELVERNINVKVESSDRYITFKLKYGNGGYDDLFFGEGKNFDGTFCFLKYFTGDKGGSYESTDGFHYTENNWNDEVYVKKLEAHIKDFVNYSERHGGF